MEPRNKGLGRGLASLIPQGPTPVPSQDGSGAYREVPFAQIRPCMTQPRKNFDADQIAELANSIKEKGILLPLLVRSVSGGYELISGERRWRAAKQLGLKEVPILVRDVLPQEQLELALIENLQRADLDPIEEAQGYADLMGRFEMTQEEVAQKVGRERSTVTNSLRLLKLPESVQALLRGKELSTGHAKVLLGQPVDHQQRLAEQIVAKGWSVRDLEQSLERPAAKKGTHKGATVTPSPALAFLLDELREALGTQVRIAPGKNGKGKIIIEYYSAEQLNELSEKLKS